MSENADSNVNSIKVWITPKGKTPDKKNKGITEKVTDLSKPFEYDIYADWIPDGKVKSKVSEVSFNYDGTPQPPQPGENRPPIASAGEDQTVQEGAQVTLDGTTSTDPDVGNILTYEWEQRGGPPVILSSINHPTATFTAPLLADIPTEPEPCPPGQHRDPTTGQCIPDTVEPPIEPPTGEFDEHGTLKIYPTTSNKVTMLKGTDHRNGQRYNVDHKFLEYMMLGYFKTGKGQEKLEHKTDGPCHGCNGNPAKLPIGMWYEPSILVDSGQIELGGEWPHPTNHSNLRADFSKPIEGGIKEQWCGYMIACYFNDKKQRVVEQWCAKNPFDSAGKPTNNWVMNLRSTETGDGKMFPSQYVPRNYEQVLNFENGFESEIRMHRGTNGDTDCKWCYVWELQTPVLPHPIPVPGAIQTPLIFSNPPIKASSDSTVTLTFRLRVTDNKGATTTDNVNVIVEKADVVVNPPIEPPVDPTKIPPVPAFTYSPLSPNPNEVVSLDSSTSSDPDGTIVSRLWTSDQVSFNNPLGELATFIFPQGQNSVDVKLTITDNDNITSSVTKTIATATIPPVQETFNKVKIIGWGDNDTTSDAEEVLDQIVKEEPVDLYVLLGDGPYSESGTKWVSMMSKRFDDTRKEKLSISQGNHDNGESESDQTEKDIEAWIPSLKVTPEVAPGQSSWEKTKWIHSKTIENVYYINMNSQDLDVEFKGRNQYNWVEKELIKADALRKEGKIDWIITAIHKPWFTLKTSHSPYTAVRNIYAELFLKYQVDVMLHGHNHNVQNWLPMVADIDESNNGVGRQLFFRNSDGSFNFKEEHGVIYVVTGRGGHEHNAFKEEPTNNKNIIWANDTDYGYTQIDIDNKKLKITEKDVTGKVQNEINVNR